MGLRKSFRKCPATLLRDVNSQEQPNWWKRVFEIMEKDAKIPLYLQEKVLEDIFPEKIIRQIISKLHVEKEGFKSLVPTTSTNNKQYTSYEKNSSEIGKGQNRYTLGGSNPYLEFFKKSKADSAIWKLKPLVPLEEVSFIEKANIATIRVAEDFVSWLKEFLEASSGEINVDLACHIFEQSFKSKPTTSRRRRSSGRKKSFSREKVEIKNVQHLKKLIELERNKQAEKRQVLSVSDVTKMFGIDCDVEVCSSVTVSVKILGSVRPPAEDLKRIPPCSYVRRLHQLIHEDNKVSSLDKTLEPKLPIIRRKGETDPYDKEIFLFNRLWQSIKDLDSTQHFCNWLIHNPKKEPPRYLLENYFSKTSKHSSSSSSKSSLSSTLSRVSSSTFMQHKP